MVSKKAITSLIVVIVVIIILGSFIIHSHLQTKTPSNGQNTQQQTPPQVLPPPQVLRAVLRVNGYVYGGYWMRDTITDLPNFVSNIRYSISNIGNANAVNVSVTIYINGKIYSSNILPLLAISEVYYSSFSVSTVYDSSSNVLIQASCQDSIDSFTISVGSNLPRGTKDPDILKLYITPKEANVVSIKNAILKNKFPLTSNWIALRDWVASNIKYPPDDVDGDGEPDYDYIKHGEWEYYQLPKETLQLRTGDCEDYAILLVSLLRADGWSPNDVYVVFGKNDKGRGHAWVKIKIDLPLLGSVWCNIEPQVGVWGMIIGWDIWSLSGYEAVCYFNDLQFHTVG